MAGSPQEAFVTLATNDSYAVGALVLGQSLRQVGTSRQLAILITAGVSQSMRESLGQVFDNITVVNVLDSQDSGNLALLSRPDLGITFTKLYCWRLTQYTKAVFMDADTLVLQNIDDLFEREEFSASPDPGWPDCFNSGVFVFTPSEDTYQSLLQFALTRGSFDGGDQGLLNLYFRDWATKDIRRHLPFVYNCVSQSFYSYLPAFKQFGADVKVAHFIGASKPWHHSYNVNTGHVENGDPQAGHAQQFLQTWWSTFVQRVQPLLQASQTAAPFTSAGSPAASGGDGDYTHQVSQRLPVYYHPPSSLIPPPYPSYAPTPPTPPVLITIKPPSSSPPAPPPTSPINPCSWIRSTWLMIVRLITPIYCNGTVIRAHYNLIPGGNEQASHCPHFIPPVPVLPYVPPDVSPLFYTPPTTPTTSGTASSSAESPSTVEHRESYSFLESFYTEPPMASSEQYVSTEHTYESRTFEDTWTTKEEEPTNTDDVVVVEGETDQSEKGDTRDVLLEGDSGQKEGESRVTAAAAAEAEVEEDRNQSESELTAGMSRVRISSGGKVVLTSQPEDDDNGRQYQWEQGQIDYLGKDKFDNIQRRLDQAIQGPAPEMSLFNPTPSS